MLLAGGASLAGANAAQAADPAQINGTIQDLPKKKPGGRAVQVVAIQMPDGVIAAADRADKRGRYALKLPGGVYALLSQVVSGRGSSSTSVLSAGIRVKPGAKRTVTLSAKKLKKHKKRHKRKRGKHKKRTRSAHTANVNPNDGRSYPGEAVATKRFTGATGGWAVFNQGLSDMLDTEISQRLGAPAGCEYTQVEHKRLAEIIAELNLQRSGLVDPSTRVEPGHIIAPDLYIEGTLTNQFDYPAPLRYEIRVVEAKTGTVRSTLKGLFNVGKFFDEEYPAFARRVVQAICTKPAPAASSNAPAAATPTDPEPPAVGAPFYSGSLSGGYDSTAVPSLTVNWSGNITLVLANELSTPGGFPEPGPYAYYEAQSGSVHATVHFTNDSCSYDGEGDVQIPAGSSGAVLFVQEGVATPAYQLGVPFYPPATVPLTRSGPAPDCTPSNAGDWSLAATSIAYMPTFQVAGSATLAGSSFHDFGGTPTTMNWNLSPSN